MTDMQNMLAGMVKPLTWHYKSEWHLFTDPEPGSPGMGQKMEYVIKHYSLDNGLWDLYGPNHWGPGNKFPTLEAAQSAAQADYTARILAALNPDAMLALVAALVRLTNDPVAVHANMLRGTIAKPSWANILHLYPIESAALVAAAYADALKSIADLPTPMTEDQARGHEDAYRAVDDSTPTDATAALARLLADARAEGYAQAQSDECGCRLGEDCAICDARAMKGEGV